MTDQRADTPRTSAGRSLYRTLASAIESEREIVGPARKYPPADATLRAILAIEAEAELIGESKATLFYEDEAAAEPAAPTDLLCPDCGHHLHRPNPGQCQWHDCRCGAEPAAAEPPDLVDRIQAAVHEYMEQANIFGGGLKIDRDDFDTIVEQERAALASASSEVEALPPRGSQPDLIDPFPKHSHGDFEHGHTDGNTQHTHGIGDTGGSLTATELSTDD